MVSEIIESKYTCDICHKSYDRRLTQNIVKFPVKRKINMMIGLGNYQNHIKIRKEKKVEDKINQILKNQATMLTLLIDNNKRRSYSEIISIRHRMDETEKILSQKEEKLKDGE